MAASKWDDFYVGDDLDDLDFDDEMPAEPDYENSEFDQELFEQAAAEDEATDASTDTSTETGSNEPKKKEKTTQEEQPTRTQRFQKEDVVQRASSYIVGILRAIPTHPCFQGKSTNALLAIQLATMLMAFCEGEIFEEFCTYLVLRMWTVITAGDKKPLSYAQTLVVEFHALATDEMLLNEWDTLLETLNIKCGQHENDSVLQHILDILLEKVLQDRNTTDLPIIENDLKGTKMNENEEQVLSYVAGFVPFALIKHYKKLKNDVAQKYTDILQQWSTDECYHGQFTFLEYTTKWIDAQSRGKLFRPNPQLYLLFRAFENETRKHLNTALIGKYRDISIRDLLLEKLSCHYLVQKYWTVLVKDQLSCTDSQNLFKVVIKYFVNIRIRAFVIVYVDLRKIKDKTVSKKGAKRLRLELNKK